MTEDSSTETRDSTASSTVGAPTGPGKAKIILGLLGAAFAVKMAFFVFSIVTSTSLSIPNAENWQDFSLAYAPAVEALKTGFVPYRDFFYPYLPPFLWTLTAFSFLPLPSWSSAIPLVGADALTVVPVYLIAREFASERTAMALSAIFILSPMNLYYVDYLWLNPPLTTLFLMSAIYLLIKKRYGFSAVALALAIGFKQTALIAFPFMLFLMWRSGVRRGEVFRYLFLVVSVCFLFSLPYLVASPTLYLDSFFRVPWDYWSGLTPSYFQIGAGTGTPVTFDTANWLTSKWVSLGAGANAPVTLILPLFLFAMPNSLLDAYAAPLLSNVGWFFLAIGLLLLLAVIRWRPRINIVDSWKYVLCAMLFAFTLYPFYKYYVVGIVPLLVLLIRNKRDALGFLGFSFAMLLIPRYFASWMLLVAFVWLLRRDLSRLLSKAVRTMFAPFASTSPRAPPGEEMDDALPYWRGRPVSNRVWFGAMSLVWFLLLMALFWPHIIVYAGASWGTLGFFATGGASAIYLMKHGPKALEANGQNTLWLSMLWGYDLPYVVVASLVFSGLIRF